MYEVKIVKVVFVVFMYVFFTLSVCAQTTITYDLSSGFYAQQNVHPDLIPLANTNGQTGNFQTTSLPTNFCPNGGEMSAYHFEDNSGFAFDNAEGFLDCEYTIELLYKFDGTPGLFESPWVFIFGFEPDQDSGFFYEFNPLFGTTFDIWRDNFNPVAEPYTVNINHWQKLTVVRYCSGIVQVYKGCEILLTYDDSSNNILLADEDQIVFFQDDPSIIASESQPGFVRNLRLSNFAMTSQQVAECCETVCDDLIDNCETQTQINAQVCDETFVGIDTFYYQNGMCDSLVIVTTTLLPSDTTYLFSTTCHPEYVGTTTQLLVNSFGCDSLVTTTTSFQEAPIIEYNIVSCVPETGGTDSLYYDCDSIVVLNVNEVIIDTLFFPPILSNTGNTVTIFGNEINQSGTYCETLTSQTGCDSTNCQTVEFTVSLSEPVSENNFFIPTAFSPNGDGINDHFVLFASSNVKHVASMQIYDRNGKLLFQQNNFAPGLQEFGWDGSLGGEIIQDGVYICVIQFSNDEPHSKYIGNLNVIK